MFKITLINNKTITEDKCSFLSLPNIPIISLEYGIGNNKSVRMSGFEKYLIVTEYYSIVQGGNGSFVDTINLLGELKNEVYQFSFNVRQRKALQRKGEGFAPMKFNPLLKKFEFSKPQKINPSLWKLGLSSLKSSVVII